MGMFDRILLVSLLSQLSSRINSRAGLGMKKLVGRAIPGLVALTVLSVVNSEVGCSFRTASQLITANTIPPATSKPATSRQPSPAIRSHHGLRLVTGCG